MGGDRAKMKGITWGDAIAWGSTGFVYSLLGFAIVWLLFATIINEAFADLPAGMGLILIVLGMTISMVIAAGVMAGYMGEAVSVVSGDGRTRVEYSRVRRSVGTALIAYVLNFVAWFVIAAYFVWFAWDEYAITASDPFSAIGQGFLMFPSILEYYVARQFGTITPFWIATLATFTVLFVITLKLMMRHWSRAPRHTKRKRRSK